MKKNALLTTLLLFLIVMNGILLFLLFKRPAPGRGAPHRFVVRELGFDDTQMEQYRVLQSDFEAAMKPLHDTRRELKHTLFASISGEGLSERELDSLTRLIGEVEKEEDSHVYAHFRAILNMCNESQKERFGAIVEEALRGQPGRGPAGHNRMPPAPLP